MGGASSKQLFEDIIKQLLNREVDPADHDFWDDLWKSTLTVEEVFEIISPDHVRKMIDTRPNNLKTLFTQAVAQLFQVVETPYPVYFDQALNCARILSRILPFMLESKSPFVQELFWSRLTVPKQNTEDSSGQSATAAAHAAIGTAPSAESKDDIEKDGKKTGEDETQESEPFAVVLVNAMFHLLFLPDFTIEDPNIDFNESDLNSAEFKSALMWAPGVGSVEKSVVSSSHFDKNRIDVLRLMIAAFCDSLYQSPESYDSCKSMWLEVATSVDAPYAEIVFYSLINTVLGYDPIGWGLPYGNLVATDTAKPLMESAIQALITLLDYGHPIRSTIVLDGSTANGVPQVTYVSADDTEAQGFNVFRRILSNIESPDQLNFIYRGFVRLLNNVHQSESTYLPYSVTRIGIEQELLILLWKCLEEIPKFMPYVLRHCDISELLVPICYFMLEGRKDPSKVGLMYLCTFTLLKLSGERNFGVSMNKPYSLRLPVDIPLFTGNHTDLLVIVLHKMIVSGLDKLSALYNCFLTIICNVSPYCKGLCTVAAVKLVNLFQLFTSPRFLYAAEGNHVYVSMILETLNNIVQYQYEGNVNVVYAIIRRREVFENLANLTLPAAIKGAADQAKVRSQKSANVSGNTVKADSKHVPKSGKSKKSAPQTSVLSSTTTSPTLDSNGVSSLQRPSVSQAPGAATISHSAAALEDDAALADMSEHDCAQTAPTDLISTTTVQARADSLIGDVLDESTHPIEATSEPSEIASQQDIVVETVPSSSESEPQGSIKDEVQQTSKDNTISATGATSMKFVPTQSWLDAVKAEMPLNTIMRLMRHLVPQVEELAVSNHGVDELQVIDFIRRTTMVGLLPVPHPIVIRKYQPNKFTCLWFTAFQWGVVFMHNQTLALFDGKTVKLFMVQTVS